MSKNTYKNAQKAFTHGSISSLKGEFEQAIYDFTEAIRLDPSKSDYYQKRGMLYAHIGQNEHAIEDSTEAIRLNSDDAIAYRTRGMIYVKSDQNENAIKDLNMAIELDENDYLAYMSRGMAYMRKINLANNLMMQIIYNNLAKSDFEKVISLNPDDMTLSHAKKMLNTTMQNEQLV